MVVSANGGAALDALHDGRVTTLRAELFTQFRVLVCRCRCNVSIGADLCDSIGAHSVPSAIEMAEGVGFEPTDACASAVFKTAAIDHSATLPTCFLAARCSPHQVSHRANNPLNIRPTGCNHIRATHCSYSTFQSDASQRPPNFKTGALNRSAISPIRSSSDIGRHASPVSIGPSLPAASLLRCGGVPVTRGDRTTLLHSLAAAPAFAGGDTRDRSIPPHAGHRSAARAHCRIAACTGANPRASVIPSWPTPAPRARACARPAPSRRPHRPGSSGNPGARTRSAAAVSRPGSR